MPFDLGSFTRGLIAAALRFPAAPPHSEVDRFAQVRTVGAITGTVTDPDCTPR